MTGCSLAEADECRRSMGSPDGQDDVRAWFYPTAINPRLRRPTVERVWEILRAFASFGFCKAHAAAFALPTYQSAWLKAHYPAAFYCGILTHDPGMYPKRLLLDDARVHGIRVLGINVNISGDAYQVEGADAQAIRVPLTEVGGISEREVQRLIDRRPFSSLSDAIGRAELSRPVQKPGGDRGIRRIASSPVTRRDLLLQVADIDRHTRSTGIDTQLSFDLLGSTAEYVPITGLPEMKASDRVRSEMSVLGLDVSAHVVDFYKDLLSEMRATAACDLLKQRSGSDVWVAGVKSQFKVPPCVVGGE